MAAPNQYAQYERNKILTAKPAELVLLLYEGVIKFCNIAIIAMEDKNMAKAHENIMKAERIIDHLIATLDRKYPVAQYFDDIYNYTLTSLIEANISKDISILQEVVENMRLVRDNWKEVMKAENSK